MVKLYCNMHTILYGIIIHTSFEMKENRWVEEGILKHNIIYCYHHPSLPNNINPFFFLCCETNVLLWQTMKITFFLQSSLDQYFNTIAYTLQTNLSALIHQGKHVCNKQPDVHETMLLNQLLGWIIQEYSSVHII